MKRLCPLLCPLLCSSACLLAVGRKASFVVVVVFPYAVFVVVVVVVVVVGKSYFWRCFLCLLPLSPPVSGLQSSAA